MDQRIPIPNGYMTIEKQEGVADDYIYMGQFTLITDKICIGFKRRLQTTKGFEADGFKEGLWNIWIYKIGRYLREIVVTYCGKNFVTNPEVMEYIDSNHDWTEPTRFRGCAYILTDRAVMDVNKNEILDMDDIDRMTNGFIIKTTSKKVTHTSVRTATDKDEITGLKIRYNSAPS